jgi:hypothetical protein
VIKHAFILLLLASYAAYGKDITRYNRSIAKAEIAIVNHDLKNGLKLYDNAIQVSGGKAFGRDLVHAFHCAMDCGAYPKAQTYLNTLLRRGMCREFIDLNLLHWYSRADSVRIEHWLEQTPNDTIKTSALAREINRLLDTDQANRHYANAHYNDAHIQDSANREDSLIARHLYNMFVQKGIPRVEEIGYLGLNPLAQPNYWIIVLHNVQGFEGYTESHLFDTLLYKGVSDWAISLSDYLQLMSNSSYAYKTPFYFQYGGDTLYRPYTINKLQYGMSEDTTQYFLQKYSLATEKRMNAFRTKYGLDDLGATRKKWDFVIRTYKNPLKAKYDFTSLTGDFWVYPDMEKLSERLKKDAAD